MTGDHQDELAAQKAFFEANGFLVLPGFFSDTAIDTVQETIDRVKAERPFDVVIDNLENGDRTVLGLMSPEDLLRDRIKINDLYLRQPVIRDMALAANIVPILRALLGHTPALCNSLYLEKGSSQDPHVDSLYMTPHTPGSLIAIWVALEDSRPDAGELEYFPGSHLIAPMIFSGGTEHVVEAEMPQWRAYIDGEIAKRNLKKVRFSAKKGDLFIWHANLLHGGGEINDPALTRKSCVFHYYSEEDARQSGCPLGEQSGALWIDRAPQPLPAEIAQRLPFSEQGYLARYPDVAAAIKNGDFTSGNHHYELFGKNEGRLPC
ncbi:MAG TPA: phytanoyl-CoA dioxygenase family protein [Alphaproteobacteria bacterium]|nr:phytanoyl-CoA dioxygenase family protein [Alphaproteobacteria bacterium]